MPSYTAPVKDMMFLFEKLRDNKNYNELEKYKTIGDIKKLENKLHQSKRKALEFSSSNFSGTYAKEVEAYVLEDKPKKVKNMIKKYCL